MIRNEFYAGYFHWNDENGEPVRMKGNHKTVISNSTYQKVQAIIRSQSVKTRVRNYEYPYKAMMSCGRCNGRVTAQRKQQIICTGCKHKFSCTHVIACPKCKMAISKMEKPSRVDRTYYHCIDKRGTCSKASVTLSELEKYLIAEFDKVKMSKGFLQWVGSELEEQNKDKEGSNLFCVNKKNPLT